MSKLYAENGFLSEEGKRIFKEVLDDKIRGLLRQAENENELRLIGSLIHKRVGDLVADAVLEKKEKMTQLQAMSDEDFEKYLEDKYSKYGKDWKLKAILTSEELNRDASSYQNKFKEWEQNQKNKPRKPHYGLKVRPSPYDAAVGPLFPKKFFK